MARWRARSEPINAAKRRNFLLYYPLLFTIKLIINYSSQQLSDHLDYFAYNIMLSLIVKLSLEVYTYLHHCITYIHTSLCGQTGYISEVCGMTIETRKPLLSANGLYFMR